MNTRKRIFIGVMGAAFPMLLNLLVVDYDAVFTSITAAKAFGYALKFTVLSGIGVFFTGLIYAAEENAVKLFQYALGAPALILSINNGSNLSEYQQAHAEYNVAVHKPIASSWSLIPTATAQEDGSNALRKSGVQFKRFTTGEQEASRQFIQGFLGRTSSNVYFVIDSKFLQPGSAITRVSELNNEQSAFKASVYLPYGYDVYYYVVVAGNLTYQEAIELKNSLIQNRISPEATLWTFPTNDQFNEQKNYYNNFIERKKL